MRASRSVAFETLTEQEALAKHPELEGTYEGLAGLKAAYAKRFAGADEQQQKSLAQAKGQILRALDIGSILQAHRDEAHQPPEIKQHER